MTLTTEEYAARVWFWASFGAALMVWGLLVPMAWGLTHP